MDTTDAWMNVAKTGILPLGLALAGVSLFKGRTIFSGLLKEWTADAEKARAVLENDRDKLNKMKDEEIASVKADLAVAKLDLTTARSEIDRLRTRTFQLVKALFAWREIARDFRHGWVNDRQNAHSWLRINDKPQRPDETVIPEVPVISELDDADNFK